MNALAQSDPDTDGELPAATRPAPPRKYQIDPQAIEHGIVNALVGHDHGHRWTLSELEREFAEVEPTVLYDTLERLRLMEVVHLDGELVWVLRGIRYIAGIGAVAP